MTMGGRIAITGVGGDMAPRQALSLPISPELTERMQATVVEVIVDFHR
jgi:hypothetical protein